MMQSREPSLISPSQQKTLLEHFQSEAINKTIAFASFKKIYLAVLHQKGVTEEVIDTIFLPEKLKTEAINPQEFLSYVKIVKSELSYHTQDSHPFGVYIGTQLLKLVGKKLLIEKESEELPVYKVPKDLQEFLHQANLQIRYTNDLLSDFQTKQLTYKKKAYTYRLWNYQSESKQKDLNPFRLKQANKYSQLLRASFGLEFKFILNTLKEMDPNDKELKVFKMVAKQFSDLEDVAGSDRQLYQFFKSRSAFNPETFKVSRKKMGFQISRNKAMFAVKWCASLSSTFKNPFLKAITAYWGNEKDWSKEMFPEICFNENLPLVDRFFFAKWNFSKEMYAMFVEEIIKIGEKSSRLQYILLFGRRQTSAQILQNYYDLTLDIETVALLSIYFIIGNFDGRTPQHQNIYQHFLSTYKENLKLSNKKIVLEMFQKKQRQIQAEQNTIDDRMLSMRCNACGSNLSLRAPPIQEYKDKKSALNHCPVTNSCPVCIEYYHRCSTCLFPTEMRNIKYSASDSKEQEHYKNESTSIELGILFCLKCKHGGHFFHIYQWFIHETVCPIPECDCECFL